PGPVRALVLLAARKRVVQRAPSYGGAEPASRFLVGTRFDTGRDACAAKERRLALERPAGERRQHVARRRGERAALRDPTRRSRGRRRRRPPRPEHPATLRQDRDLAEVGGERLARPARCPPPL